MLSNYLSFKKRTKQPLVKAYLGGGIAVTLTAKVQFSTDVGFKGSTKSLLNFNT